MQQVHRTKGYRDRLERFSNSPITKDHEEGTKRGRTARVHRVETDRDENAQFLCSDR